MHIVNISLDPKVLDKDSVVSSRVREYGKHVEEYTVIVPGDTDQHVVVTKNISIYAVSGFGKLVKFFRIYRAVEKLIQNNKCDVISTDQYYFGLLGYLLAKKHHLGFEVQALGFEKLNPLRKLIARFVFAKASSIRVLNFRFVHFLETVFRVTGEKVRIVPIYVNTQLMRIDTQSDDSEIMQEYTTSTAVFEEKYGKYFNFVSVNRLVHIKNIPLQLHAMQMLIKKYPQARLHIVGDGPEKESLQKEITHLGLHEHVFLHGYTDGVDLGVYYAQSDCFLLTSHSEGWGMVVIEALEAQLPVIMTDVGCAGEVIIDKESGIVIAVDDVVALHTSMKSMIYDVQYRENLITGGKKALESLLTMDEIVSLYVQSWAYSQSHKL